MELVGHRGDPRHAPENTLASLEQAWRHGRRAVECDVRASRDHVPVIFHDATLDRMTSGRGPVANQPWRALRLLGIASLADALTAFRGRPARFFLDVKVAGQARAIVRAIHAARMASRCRICSFHGRTLTTVRRAAPQMPRYRVTGASQPLTPRVIERARRSRLRGFVASTRWVTPAAARRVRAAGLELYVWTIRRRTEERRFKAMGVTGVMTERCPHSIS